MVCFILRKATNNNVFFIFWILCIFCLGVIINGCSKSKKADLFELEWKKSEKNPVVEPGFYGWDSKQVYTGTILKINDDYRMWYYGNDENGPLEIGIKKSKDGIDWRKIQDRPVLTNGENDEWDNLRVSKPCVVLEDNLYKMWYLGESRQNNKIVPKIGLATSPDGISWSKNESNPIFDLEKYEFPWAVFLRYFWILKENDHYKMWFSAVGVESYNNIESIGYAWSQDGINWEVYPQPVLERDTLSVWEDFYVSNPCVIKKDSTYYMFYGGLGRYGYLFKESIGIAKSNDGKYWQKYAKNPILFYTEVSDAWDREFVTQPRVLQIKRDLYYLWYTGADKKNTKEELGNYQIGLAIGKF